MGQRSRDDKAEPSLELPSLPGFGRRKKTRRDRRAAGGPAPAAEPLQPEAQSPDTPQPEPEEHAEPTLTLSENGAPRRRAEKRSRPEPARGPESRNTREPRTTPLVPGRLAALLTGIAVGAAGAAGTYGAMAGCKAVRGVSTCGGAPGFFILVAILVLMVLLGTGVLTLLGVICSVWMVAVIPAVSGAAFRLAHWVTTRFADEDKGRRDWT